MHWFYNKTCDLSVMKSCVFSLFTSQMASQFPKHDNHSAEHVWFCVCFISDLSLSQWITNTFWQHHRECSTIGHGSYGSWVTRSDPSLTLADGIVDHSGLSGTCCQTSLGRDVSRSTWGRLHVSHLRPKVESHSLTTESGRDQSVGLLYRMVLCIALTVLSHVCPSVCPSHAGFVSKWLNLS